MSGLENLQTRLSYAGGSNQEKRIIKDKLNSLKKALLYSYQAETIQLNDGREFKCLINPNKETADYDNKIISIPYKDICLNSKKFQKQKTSHGIEEIGLKCGDTFLWKETNSHWLVFLQYIEENAYFRAQIRRCDQEIEINGRRYWTYIKGPVEAAIIWNQKAGVEWNDLNYSLVMFITADEYTSDYFHRFKKIKINESNSDKQKTWQVAGANHYYADGIIAVYLDECFENPIEEAVNKEKLEQNQNKPNEEDSSNSIKILGPDIVNGYSIAEYELNNDLQGEWFIKQYDKVSMVGTGKQISIDVNMKKGTFMLMCIIDEETIIQKQITVSGI